MADGYARASGKLVSCNVHVAPGLGNAIGSIYTSLMSGTPMIVTAGQQEQGHGLTEPLLYAPLVPIASPVVKWATEVNRIEDLPRILRRAAKVATTAPTGPVFISLPGDILNNEAAIDMAAPTRVDTAVRPSDAALEQLAKRLLGAKKPVILAGHEIATSDAFAEATALAETLGAPVLQQTVAWGAHFPSEHPAYLGALNRDQKNVRRILSDYDLMFCVGADVLKMSVWSETEPLPETTAVAMVGLRDWEMGKNFPAEIALRADVKETLKALVPLLKKLGGDALADKAKASLAEIATRNWSAQRAARKAKLTAARQREAAACRMGDDAARREDAQGRHPGRGRPHQHDDAVQLFPLPRPQQLLRQCQRRHRLGHRRGGRRADRPPGPARGGGDRRRQRHVLDHGAVECRQPEAAGDLHHRQQCRLPDPQDPPETVSRQ